MGKSFTSPHGRETRCSPGHGPALRRNKSLLSCSCMKTWQAAEGKTCQASSQRTPSPSNAHAAAGGPAPCKSRVCSCIFYQCKTSLCSAEKSPPLTNPEQSLQYFTHAQTTGRTSSARLLERQACKYFVGSSCLPGCGLQKIKQTEPQTLSNKQACFLLLCTRTGGNGGPAEDGLGRDGVHQSHLHPAPRSQGTSNK